MIEIGKEKQKEYAEYLRIQEKSPATIQKYVHDIKTLSDYIGDQIEGKSELLDYKHWLLQKGYATASVNSMLAAVNGFLTYLGKPEWKLRFLKVQCKVFQSNEKYLTKAEYERLVRAAQKRQNRRLVMILETICACGIRVSELQFITLKSLCSERVEIRMKGKIRIVLLPKELCRVLQNYCKAMNIEKGPVFVTRSGKPIDRSNIWKMMKSLCCQADVLPEKVFPHNLRHLFATEFYRQFQDIVHLADILGHSNINTTRIYTCQDGAEQKRQIEKLDFVI